MKNDTKTAEVITETPAPVLTTVTAKDLAKELKTEAKILRKTLRALAEAGEIPAKNQNWAWVSNDPALTVIKAKFKPPVSRN